MSTPARRLRSRNETPLPALRTRSSNAYGAQGKASLRTQVTTTATAFDDAFENAQPRQSVAPRATQRGSRKSSAASSKQAENGTDIAEEITVQTVTPVPPVQHERDDSQSSEGSEERPGTSLQISAIYGENLLAREAAIRAMNERQAETNNRNRDHEPRQYEPGPIQLFFRTLPRYLPRLLRDTNSQLSGSLLTGLVYCATLFAIIFFTYGWLSNNALPESSRHQTVTPHNPSHNTWVPSVSSRSWYSYLHDRLWGRNFNMTLEQYEHNTMLMNKIESLETSVAEISKQARLDQSTLKMFQDMMPSMVVLREIDGKYDIDARFWNAFMERLISGESASLWQDFLRSNQDKWSDLTYEALDKAIEDGQVLSASSFSKMVDEKFQLLQTSYSEDFASLQESHFDLIESIANRTAVDVFNRNPLSEYAKSQLETLVKANQIHGAFEALKKPNYFSVGMGARIDNYLTSPTMQRAPETWAQWLWTHFSPIQYNKHPPIAALQRWEEATDCWCSSPSRDQMGKAQLTINLPVKIYPDVLVVEHVPASGTLDIASAPRELEIWADLETPSRAQQMIQQLNEKVSLYQQYSGKCSSPPTPNFVCIGKARYDVHSHKHIQSSQIWVDAVPLNLLTKKISIRVTENYGSNWTCIYRLRMTGMRPREDTQ